MSRGAFLTGAVGGIVGAITVTIWVVWLFVFGSLSADIEHYVTLLNWNFSSLFGPYLGNHFTGPYPYPIPYFPSWSLFGVFSFVLVVFLIVTGLLIGAGFFGTYKIGGGAASVVGATLSVVGITAGALLIMFVNLTTGYEQTYLFGGYADTAFVVNFFPIPTPNFPLIVVGFIILCFALIVLGSVSISVREMTEKPSFSKAAGILSIVAAVFIILCSLFGSIPVTGMFGGVSNNITFGIFFGGIIGFLPMLIAFILWAWVFYSSRNL